MKLLALSDLHVGDPNNRRAIEQMAARPDDWLILGGDLGETFEQISFVFRTLAPRYKQLVWVPGNHELWSLPGEEHLRGPARYDALVTLCREVGVLCPEDPYPVWEGEGPRCTIVPMFLLYDYSFRPDDVTREQAIGWALEEHIMCTDEEFLHAEPYETRDAWCEARCQLTEKRLAVIDPTLPTVLINHYPLRQEHAWLPAIPRFSLWCGTRRTTNWHKRYRAHVVVGGHLHIRTTRWLDNVRFEEVSLGYARHWMQAKGADGYLREILPGPSTPGEGMCFVR